MGFMNSIISWLGTARDYFLNAYWTVSGWVYPFNLLATPLYYIFLAFYYLTSSFGELNNWLVYATTKLGEILSLTAITSYFQTWINYAKEAYYWIVTSWYQVTSIIQQWWSASNNPIRLYIDQAIAAIGTLPSWLVSEFTSLKTAWDNFWSYTFPQWTASIQNLWNSFTTFVASIGQTILSHLNAFWDSTIFPAISSIWQALSALHIPSWDEIWSFIFSKLPGIDDLLNWWSEFWQDVKEFFTDFITWACSKWTWDTFLGWISPFFEAAGGTEAERDEEYSKVPPVEVAIDELTEELKGESPYIANVVWGFIEPEIAKIRAKVLKEIS